MSTLEKIELENTQGRVGKGKKVSVGNGHQNVDLFIDPT
jgi:hypothetical protein